MDGTPIYDIKPYLPYVDAVPAAQALEFDERPILKRVEWRCPRPEQFLLIEQVVALDPRPGHEKKLDQDYGVSVAGMNVRFKEENEALVILSANPFRDELARN